ncbi:hypothetical protein [Enterococcus malodoratus]|uniref:hypothetical protein n=1 Tax=Enterococcus malodoratus TaxID=71451 RepID=UPI0020748328|nr:hypothetical protein [Enterococcus malodoratus]
MPLEIHELLLVFVVILSVLGLQIFLSLREGKYWGLIMPVLFLIYSLYNLSKTTLFSELTSGYYKFGLVLQASIPTIMLIAVYFICRKIRNK